MSQFTRTVQQLKRVIEILEELIESRCSLTKVRRLERMLVNLRGVRRSIQRVDKTDPKGRKKFWQLYRRAVLLSVRIARGLSST